MKDIRGWTDILKGLVNQSLDYLTNTLNYQVKLTDLHYTPSLEYRNKLFLHVDNGLVAGAKRLLSSIQDEIDVANSHLSRLIILSKSKYDFEKQEMYVPAPVLFECKHAQEVDQICGLLSHLSITLSLHVIILCESEIQEPIVRDTFKGLTYKISDFEHVNGISQSGSTSIEQYQWILDLK